MLFKFPPRSVLLSTAIEFFRNEGCQMFRCQIFIFAKLKLGVYLY